MASLDTASPAVLFNYNTLMDKTAKLLRCSPSRERGSSTNVEINSCQLEVARDDFGQKISLFLDFFRVKISGVGELVYDINLNYLGVRSQPTPNPDRGGEERRRKRNRRRKFFGRVSGTEFYP